MTTVITSYSIHYTKLYELAAKLGITFIFFIAILYLDKEKKKMFFKFYLALSPFIIASAVPALLDRDYSSFWEITSSLLSSNMIVITSYSIHYTKLYERC